jgi:hypothetical protein
MRQRQPCPSSIDGESGCRPRRRKQSIGKHALSPSGYTIRSTGFLLDTHIVGDWVGQTVRVVTYYSGLTLFFGQRLWIEAGSTKCRHSSVYYVILRCPSLHVWRLQECSVVFIMCYWRIDICRATPTAGDMGTGQKSETEGVVPRCLAWASHCRHVTERTSCFQ